MRKKPYPVMQLTGGLDVSVDPLFLTDANSPDLSLVRFYNGMLRKAVGFTVHSTLPARPMLIYTYEQSDGDKYLIGVTLENAYEWDGDEWVLISDIGNGNAFTGTADNIFHAATYNDLFIVTNGKDDIQKWDGSDWEDLGGSPPLAKNMIVFYDHLILLNTVESGTEYPWRVTWCDTGNPEIWDSGNAGFLDLMDTPDWCVGAALLRDRCFIVKERSIWELIYVGPPNMFEYRIIVSGVGTYSSHSIQNAGDHILIFGNDDTYSFDGSRLTAIGEALKPLFFITGDKQVNLELINRSPAVYIQMLQRYEICLPTSSSDLDTLFAFSLKYKGWMKRPLDVTAIGFYQKTAAGVKWEDAVGAWNSGDWDVPWLEQAIPPGAPTTLYATIDGTVYEDARTGRTTDRMTWVTKDFQFGHAVRWVEFRVQVKGGPFSISYSLDGGLSYSQSVVLTPSETEFQEHVMYLNETSQKIRAKIVCDSEDLIIQWIEPWYVERKRSKVLHQ